MKPRTTQIILAMATLVVFSTLSTDVLAQRSSVASMTIRATVVESASIQTVNDLRFSQAIFNEGNFVSVTDQHAEFVVTGTADADISVSVSSLDLENGQGSDVVFTPRLVSANGSTANQQRLEMKSSGNGSTARASVWVEGRIESKNEADTYAYSGRYVVDAVFN